MKPSVINDHKKKLEKSYLYRCVSVFQIFPCSIFCCYPKVIIFSQSNFISSIWGCQKFAAKASCFLVFVCQILIQLAQSIIFSHTFVFLHCTLTGSALGFVPTYFVTVSDSFGKQHEHIMANLSHVANKFVGKSNVHSTSRLQRQRKKTPNFPQQETHVAVRLLVFDEGLCPDLQDVRDALIPELCCKGFDLAAMPWVADQVPLFLGSKQVTIFRKSKRDPPTV